MSGRKYVRMCVFCAERGWSFSTKTNNLNLNKKFRFVVLLRLNYIVESTLKVPCKYILVILGNIQSLTWFLPHTTTLSYEREKLHVYLALALTESNHQLSYCGTERRRGSTRTRGNSHLNAACVVITSPRVNYLR